MRRFHIDSDSIEEGVVALSKEETHHAVSVLRLKTGDAIGLLDGQGRSFKGIVVGVQNSRMAVAVRENSRKSPLSEIQITLAPSVIKPEKMDLMIQKSCELGVAHLCPLISERSVVRLTRERWELKATRWRKIIVESCKQCGRTVYPALDPVQKLEDFLGKLTPYDKILLPTLAVDAVPLYSALKGGSARKVMVFIGPEGDFSRKEAEKIISLGAQAVTLGPLVMRSETAALYLLSALNFFYNEVKNADVVPT